MADEAARRTKCGNCSTLLKERSDLSLEERRPCPSCGSIARRFELDLESKLDLRSSLRVRARHGHSRWFLEHFVGDDWWRRMGRWVRKVRRIDRDADRYLEIIADPETGTVIHKKEEPLSTHRGHGSARTRH